MIGGSGVNAKKRKLDEDQNEILPIRTREELFPIGFAKMFKRTAIDNSAMETRRTVINFSPADQYEAMVFNGYQYGNGVGINKINKAKIMVEFKVVQGNNNDLGAQDSVLLIERPANNVWQNRRVKVNDRVLGVENPYGIYASYLHQLTKGRKEETKYDKTIKLSHKNNYRLPRWVGADAAGANGLSALDNFNARKTNHTVAGADIAHAQVTYNNYALGNGAAANNNNGDKMLLAKEFNDMMARSLLVKDWCEVVDNAYFPIISEDDGAQIPSCMKLEFELHRHENAVILQHGTNENGAKLLIRNLKIEMPLVKPNDQMMEGLNSLMAREESMQYYTADYQMVTYTLPQAGANGEIYNFNQQDIFSGSIPTRIFIFQVAQDDLTGGSSRSNPFVYRNMRISNTNVTVNNSQAACQNNRISTTKQAYSQLRNVLGFDKLEMPISFDEFRHSKYMLAYDLTPGSNAHLNILHPSPSGQVNVNLTMTRDDPAEIGYGIHDNSNAVASYICVVGDFRNEYSVWMTKPPEALYNH